MGSLSTSRILLIGLVVVALASFLPLGVSGYILGLLVSNFGWQTAAQIQIVGLPFLSALICFLFSRDF